MRSYVVRLRSGIGFNRTIVRASINISCSGLLPFAAASRIRCNVSPSQLITWPIASWYSIFCALPLVVCALPAAVCDLSAAVCNLSPPSNCAILYVRTTIRAPTGINSGRICRLIKLLVVLPPRCLCLRVICVFALFAVCFALTLLIVS